MHLNHLKGPRKHPGTGEEPRPLNWEWGHCCQKMEILGQGLQHRREGDGEEAP